MGLGGLSPPNWLLGDLNAKHLMSPGILVQLFACQKGGFEPPITRTPSAHHNQTRSQPHAKQIYVYL